MAGANHVHNAFAGGRNHALDAREVLAALLEELGYGYSEGLRYLAKGFGTRLEVTIFDPREVRPSDARALA
jgi:hypothetical protein